MHVESHVAELVSGIITLLLVAIAIYVFTKRIRLPFTVILVVVGITLSALAEHYPTLEVLQELEISSDLILFVFLPTLIFESTYNMDSRLLRHNLGPVLTLAVPGLLLSSALIGLILWAVTPIPLVAALLLGAILSATDPVSVVALFKQLGAPERLTILVEGESLFNDATSIVVAGILIGIISAGTVSMETVSGGVLDLFTLFLGGLILGVVLASIAGLILGMFESEPFVEISITTVLAYLSFLLAEEVFHVSGVMATVGAGLTIGSWGQAKISPSVRIYLEHFWELMAFLANAFIFLMVGLKVELASLSGELDTLFWVIVAMLVARAVLVYGLMPLVGRLPGSKPVSLPYQTVMYWGGLRGAIALAIVLSLPALEQSELFVALVTGAVLFTLLAQGLTIEPLMKRLHLDTPPLSDRLALMEKNLLASQLAQARIPDLQSGGLFSSIIARRLQQECDRAIQRTRSAITSLREQEMNPERELNLLYLRAFSEERAFYQEMYSKGHLSEAAYRETQLVLTLQIDAIRHHGVFEHVHSHRLRRQLEHVLFRLLDSFRWLTPLAEKLRMERIIRDYEGVWGHYQGSAHVLNYLDQLNSLESIPEEIFTTVQGHYQRWHKQAQTQLDRFIEQFPEFVTSMQERLGQRLKLLSELEATEEQAARGMLPKGVIEQLEVEIAERLSALRGQSVEKLEDNPEKLLRKVPLFNNLSGEERARLVELLIPHTLPENETVISQGEEGSSLYLITRGVVRITREDQGRVNKLGTLMAGDFFGEMALIHHSARNASITTVSPCRLYELRREDLDALTEEHPEIGKTLAEADRMRQQECHSDNKSG